MKVFVPHYSKLTQRKTHMLNQFKKHGINDYEFIQDFDKENLTDTDIARFTNHLKDGEKSLTLKFFSIFKQISKCTMDYALIFEDDVILCDGFSKCLGSYMEQLPIDFDMLFIGDGCGFHIEKDKILPGVNIYKKEVYPTRFGGDGCSRCMDSIIISKECALKLCEYIDNLKSPIDIPLDFLVNKFARDQSLTNVYWAEPTIVTQGSENGLFKSSLR
jgi:GR25 family glycosyltransferase involved in LPS biosynthesis